MSTDLGGSEAWRRSERYSSLMGNGNMDEKLVADAAQL